jgi:hypothetical protein
MLHKGRRHETGFGVHLASRALNVKERAPLWRGYEDPGREETAGTDDLGQRAVMA